jgi:hypothetical protein
LVVGNQYALQPDTIANRLAASLLRFLLLLLLLLLFIAVAALRPRWCAELHKRSTDTSWLVTDEIWSSRNLRSAVRKSKGAPHVGTPKPRTMDMLEAVTSA